MAREVYFHIELNKQEAEDFFIYAGYHVRDMRAPFRKVAYRVILPGIQLQFLSEGLRSGGWRPLNAKYAEQKAKDGYGYKPILERTGAMKMDLFDPKAIRITKDHLSYSPGSLNQEKEYGTRYDYIHQSGLGNVPARPWLVITHEDEAHIERIFVEWLSELRDANRSRGSGSDIFLGNIPTGWTLI